MFKKKQKPKCPQEFGLYDSTEQRYDYERFERKVTVDELEAFKRGDPEKIISYAPDYARDKIIYCGFNGNVLTGVYEKPCNDKTKSKKYKIFFPGQINSLRPRDWERLNYYPNLEFQQFLNTKLEQGFILEKIIVNQFIFRPLSKSEQKPTYLIVDRDSENYHPLNYKNFEILQLLIETYAQKGYRFLGGFFGARMDTGMEYSGWIFITDPKCEIYRYFVLPIYYKFLDIYYCYDPNFLQTLQSWAHMGWDILSVLFGIIKEEKALQYYPITKYLPFVVVRQPSRMSSSLEHETPNRAKAPLNNFPSFRSSPVFGGSNIIVKEERTEPNQVLSAREDYSSGRNKQQNKFKATQSKTTSGTRIPKINSTDIPEDGKNTEPMPRKKSPKLPPKKKKEKEEEIGEQLIVSEESKNQRATEENKSNSSFQDLEDDNDDFN